MKAPLTQAGRLAEWRDRLFIYSVLLFSFAISFGGHIASPLIAIFGLSWILDNQWKEKFERIKKNKIQFIPFLLYIIYLAGMVYTEDKNSGFSQLETKLSLLIGPVIFSSIIFPAKLTRKKIFTFFIAGCAAAMVLCFGHAIYNFYNEKWEVAHGILRDTFINTEYFYASRLSFIIHPSYFAMYICLAIFYIFSQAFHNTDNFSGKQLKFLLFLNLIFSIFLFFLASRLGLIVMLLIWFGVVVYFILWKKMYIRGILMLASIIIAFIALYKFSPVIASRFDYVIETMRSKKIDKTTTESSGARRLIWSAGMDIIKANWLTGVGTGDVSNSLVTRYNQLGMTGASDNKWNSHNQFLQTFIATGILGFIALLAMIIVPLYVSIKEKKYLLLVFLLIFTLNILVECMLEAEAGVLFFFFFYSVLHRISADNSNL